MRLIMRLALCGLIFLSAEVMAENLGRFEVKEVVLRPRFDLLEPAQGNFTLGESMASLAWMMEPGVSAQVSVGPDLLLGKTVHFTDTQTDQIALIEGYGEFAHVYGVWRLGMQPVGLSLEGQRRESELQMPRGLLYRSRWVGLRDLGLSYAVENNGYFTRLMVHNGEGGRNTDGRPWYTGAWGWRDGLRLNLGVNGQTGTTKPSSTSSTSNILGGVDVSKEALWRIGGPFISWTPPRWRVELEYLAGEVEQQDAVKSYSWGRFELQHQASQQWTWGLRYEYQDSHRDIRQNEIEEISLALGLKTHRSTSVVWLMGTKALEKGSETPNDRLLLMWQLSPLYQSLME